MPNFSAPPSSDFTYKSRDGLTLFGQAWGDPAASGLPVVCLPGLTRNSRDFEALASALAGKRRVIALDFRGRGRSDYGPVATYTPAMEADDVLRALGALGIPKAMFIGTSRGGLVMLVLAMTHPSLFGAAVFNDIGPAIETAGLARIASYVGRPVPTTWPAVIEHFKEEQVSQFPSLDQAGWERFARQVFREKDGVPMLDYDPAMEIAFRAFNPNVRLPEAWPAFKALGRVPVMVVHGALSDILSHATVERMRSRHPGLEVVNVADQGHAPLLWDRPTQTRIADFLEAADPRDRPDWRRRFPILASVLRRLRVKAA